MDSNNRHRCRTHYSEELSDEQMSWVTLMAELVARVKTYIHRHFGGSNSLYRLTHYEVRRILKHSGVEQQLANGMAKHMYDNAVKRAVAEIKAEWTMLAKRVNRICRARNDLTKDELGYIYIVTSDFVLLGGVLSNRAKSPTLDRLREVDDEKRRRYEERKRGKGQPYSSRTQSLLNSDAIDKLTSDRLKVIWSMIRRYCRQEKNDSSTRTIRPSVIYIDATIARWDQSGLHITRSSSAKKGPRVKRICIPMRSWHCSKLSETVISVDGLRVRIAAHIPSKAKPLDITPTRRSIGLDKGYRDLLISSDGHTYGSEYRVAIRPRLALLQEKGRRRNRYWSQYHKLMLAGKTVKAQRILDNNLGRKRITKLTEAHRSHKRSFINRALNELFDGHTFNHIVVEDLSGRFDRRKRVSLSRQMRGELSQWDKGYLQRRIDFKSMINRVEVTLVNPAYTSQQCHACHKIGLRQGRHFTCTNTHCSLGKCDADINAARTILQRKDAGIELWFKPERVRAIIDAL